MFSTIETNIDIKENGQMPVGTNEPDRAAVETKRRRRAISTTILLLIGNLLFCSTLWLLDQYDRIRFDQLLYQLKTSAEGAEPGLVISGILRIVGLGLLMTLAELVVLALLSGRLLSKLGHLKGYVNYCHGKICRLFARSVLPIAVALLLVSTTFFAARLDVVASIYTMATPSDFIESHYVKPTEENVIFPTQKRNLIYIFMESMESTFGDPTAGGIITDDFIPELSDLADVHVSFSNQERIGGFLPYEGTTWTAAAMVAQTAGVTIKVPLLAGTYDGTDSYMTGLVSLGDLLHGQGYTQTLLLGSDAGFACREEYFTQHGHYRIMDVDALKSEGRLPDDYNEWWGFEDAKLYEFAKEELTRLGQGEEPFNLTLLTADTHFPDGYWCEKCESEHGEQYANVLSCASKQVYEFVSWVQEQPFYENTTVVICGDHLTMDPNFLADVSEDFVRTSYNCIINSAVEPSEETNRQFGAFDLFPTTLAAMGVEIKGDRLALGTNLFSDTPTLTEQYGYDFLNTELQKDSDYYNKTFFEP